MNINEGIKEEHYWFVNQVVTNIVGKRNKDMIDEITQEVFVRILAKPRKVKNVRAYIFKTAVNTAKTFLKKSNKKLKRETTLTELKDKTYEGVENKVITKEEIKLLKKALNKLSERERKIFIMREYEGRSYAEISLITGENTGTLRSIVSRTRAKILNILKTEVEK